jgi:hypothetical protein
MDQQTQKKFDQILTKDIVELTVHDKAFLRARSVYLDRHHKRRLASILDATPEPIQEMPQVDGKTPNQFPGVQVDDDGEIEQQTA